jgi:hypothetical protein
MQNSENTKIFIEKANTKHNGKYDYAKTNYIVSRKKVIITCKIHGDFEQIAASHLAGNGCNKCGIIQKAKNMSQTTEDFIKKAKKIHKNSYNYAKVVYNIASKPVTIICKVHGDFEQLASSHLAGYGCKKCGLLLGANKHLLTTPEFIQKAQHIHGENYNYLKTEYNGTRNAIIITCKIHGDFEQLALSHLAGHGCKKCGSIQTGKKQTMTTEQFIQEVKKKYGEKYDYSKTIYTGSKISVIIICKIHGKFTQVPNLHLFGRGCKKCSKLKKNNTINLNGLINKTSKTDKFIGKAIKVHNNKYNYSKVDYEGVKKSVVIICPTHGNFEQLPTFHLNGSGCNKCAINSRTEKLVLNTEEFIQRAVKKHGNKYNYEKTNYTKNMERVTIICKNHGEFDQVASAHLQGCGCPTCGIFMISKKLSMPLDEFIKRSHDVYSNKYDYSKLDYVNTSTKVTIICKDHGEFSQTPNNHLSGSGCQKCMACPGCLLWRTNGNLCDYCKPQSISKQYQKTKEMGVIKFIKSNLPYNDFIHNKSVGLDCTDGHLFPDIRFDCMYYNLIIEIDEHQHRGANYECDKQRMYNIIAKLGLPCIFIRYNPDNPKSDKTILVQTIEKYLDLNVDGNGIWNDFGFFCEYLYYTDKSKIKNNKTVTVIAKKKPKLNSNNTLNK